MFKIRHRWIVGGILFSTLIGLIYCGMECEFSPKEASSIKAKNLPAPHHTTQSGVSVTDAKQQLELDREQYYGAGCRTDEDLKKPECQPIKPYDPDAWKKALNPEEQAKLAKTEAEIDARQARFERYKAMPPIELVHHLRDAFVNHAWDDYGAIEMALVANLQQADVSDPAYGELKNVAASLQDYTEQTTLINTLKEINTSGSTGILLDWYSRLGENPETHNLRIDLMSIIGDYLSRRMPQGNSSSQSLLVFWRSEGIVGRYGTRLPIRLNSLLLS